MKDTNHGQESQEKIKLSDNRRPPFPIFDCLVYAIALGFILFAALFTL